ncbi:MAG: arsenite methyltransferase [Dehalococcoidia bacterium]|nr:arsenite methyltransferase [Dehalococcoidia bacterium]
MKNNEIRKAVRESYAKVARQHENGHDHNHEHEHGSCCGEHYSYCHCSIGDHSTLIGYTDDDKRAAPREANLGLGCGNPLAFASLKEGEVVLDLGSGAGFDCLLAAGKVGKTGHVIGVDMTPEMIDRARQNAFEGHYTNVEFRLGEIENLPLADNSVDVIISNCVINLSPEKGRTFSEAFRVLKPGGRLLVSDIVVLYPIPEIFHQSIEMYASCLAGASLKADYLSLIESAGFKNVQVVDETTFGKEYLHGIIGTHSSESIITYLDVSDEEIEKTADSIISLKVSAIKN